MNRTITALISFAMAAFALQAAPFQGRTATKASPRDYFEINKTTSSILLNDDSARAKKATESATVYSAPKFKATAASEESPKFVGLLNDGSDLTLSTTTIGENPETTPGNYIQQGFAANAGVFVNGKYSVVLEYTMADMCFLYSYDSSVSWALAGQTPLRTPIHPTALTYDTKTSSVYGCFAEDDASYTFGFMDLSSGMKIKLGNLDQKYTSMAADKSGTIYAIGADNALYTIGAFTSAVSKIGDTGITPAGASSISFDYNGQTLYWFVNNKVYTLDTASGSATEYCQLSGEWTGVAPMPEAEKLIPSWIDELSVNFPEGTLTGDVSFKLPTTATTGASLTSSVTYHLQVDEKEYTGSGLPGATISVPMTLEQGMHTFVATAEYDGMLGLQGSQNKYIGHDTPSAPANIVFVENGNDVNLSWQPVTTGINGGYINLDALRYTVVRNPGNTSIAKDLAEPACTDATIDALDYYTYTVTACDGVNTSAPGTSEVYFPGTNLGFKPPYSHDFSTGMGLFVPEDVNNDGTTWHYSDGFVWFQTDAETDNDDWIISPPVTLEANKNYSLSIDLLASANWEYQIVEIYYGKSQESTELTTRILPAYPFQVRADIDTNIAPEEDGQYYFGVHVITKKTAGAVSITNFAIGAGYDSSAPGAASNLTATPGDKGAKSATISFTCPDKNFSGEPLDAITRITVVNQTTGTTVKEITDATPGSQITGIVDDTPADGNNTYSVVCCNESGEGLPAQTSCWTGIDFTAKPENIKWIQNGNSVHLTWEAPTTGIHGGYIGEGNFKYRVTLNDDANTILTETADLFFDMEPEFTNPQDVLMFSVAAVNEAGEGEKGNSNQSAAGTPYPTPFYESFENVALHSTPWLVKPLSGYNSINIVTNVAGLVDMEGNAVTAVDYDYGMAVYTPLAAGATRLELPVIDISGLSTPVLKMWCFFLDDKTTVTIQGNNNSGNEWSDISSFTQRPQTRGWNLVVIPLDKVKGEARLQLGIHCATPEKALYVLFDKISIEEGHDTDMILADVTFPTRLYAGQDFNSTLKVINGGIKESPASEVQLFIDGKIAAAAVCPALTSGQTAEIPLTAHLSSNATSARLQAQVLCANDADITNNALMADIYVVRSSLPAPEELTNISENNNAILLSWTAPDCIYEAPVTDSFETLEAGSIGGIDVRFDESNNIVATKTTGELGDYQLIDNDKLPTTTTALTTTIPNANRGMVCQVIDVKEFNLRGNSAIWEAHSGDKLLSFWNCYDESVPNDDWFILPKLSESNKQISFWAKSLTSKYNYESFDIMVSTETDAIEDFERFAQAKDIPAGYATNPEAGYTLYEFDLPEEAEYVAIRYNACGSLALLIDDLTYTPAGNTTEAHLLGYNIYRNDIRLNEQPLTETELNDIPEDDGDYYYNVTAVYSEGESPYSNTVTVADFSEVENVSVADNCSINVENNTIVVTCATQTVALVYAPDGRLLREANVAGKAFIPMVSGIYIVKAGNTTKTVIIK